MSEAEGAGLLMLIAVFSTLVVETSGMTATEKAANRLKRVN